MGSSHSLTFGQFIQNSNSLNLIIAFYVHLPFCRCTKGYLNQAQSSSYQCLFVNMCRQCWLTLCKDRHGSSPVGEGQCGGAFNGQMRSSLAICS